MERSGTEKTPTIVRFRPGLLLTFDDWPSVKVPKSKARAGPKASLGGALEILCHPTGCAPARATVPHTQTREILFPDRRTCGIASYGTSWVYGRGAGRIHKHV
ncbi:hypothetical protein K0M31_010971 [Melipona bicolor]|uniref:Uncharacterized protein n=1 Tax=Melipona bicolor TaxID=60889 RepID=A0AA40FKG1_9HYME|nr:hypothetical protein K0M31_010971 [Melipona bicolor]